MPLLLSASVVSDSVRPHRRQPTDLPHPWDSLGKNTGVGCHFLLQCMKVKSESEVAQSCPTLCDPMDCSPPGSSVHGIFQATVLEWGAIAFSGYMYGISKKKKNAICVFHSYILQPHIRGFPGGSAGKESACTVGDLDSIPGLGRSPGEGNDYPFQYSGLENSMNCIVHKVARGGHD